MSVVACRKLRNSVIGLMALANLAACSDSDDDPMRVISSDNQAPWTLDSYQGKPASSITRQVLQEAQVPRADFADGAVIADHARETLIADLPETMGSVAVAEHSHSHSGKKPVHPSLGGYVESIQDLRGLFNLADGLYQVRGGLAYLTFLRGEKGWIVLDTGMTEEFASAAWDLARSHIPGGESVPISAVIYSHSHVDHFGGVRGLITQEAVDAGEVSVIAPYGFMDHTLAENVIAGSAMFRRADYHFGSLLDAKDDGTEYFSFVPPESGSLSLIRPTIILPAGQGEVTAMKVDGVAMEFMDIGGAEAPAGTLIYLPKQRMIFNSELMFHGMHNIYTLRGAQVRDALTWSKLINRVIVRWGDEAECMTGPHGPSFCGQARLIEFMKTQRDNYGLVHAQSVRLINSGRKLQDVGELVERLVPASLSEVWPTHGFHGTYSHNARGVVTRYLGFYDGNPTNLNPLPLRQEATKYVEYMGGSGAVLAAANRDFERGEYRFVATVLGKLVLAEPDNWPARHLLADTLEQLGYQSEGPQWRNAYLSAAKELRVGRVLTSRGQNDISGLLAAASVEELMDALAVRVNADKAAGKEVRIQIHFTDLEEYWLLELRNGNLSAIAVGGPVAAETSLTLRLEDLFRLASGDLGMPELAKLAWVSIDGSPLALATLLLTLESGDSAFPLIDG